MIRRKLRGERGASIVFAFVVFLMASMFSVTMVNGALTAVQNTAMQQREEQVYLNVTSAARLFCAEVNNRVITLTKETEDTGGSTEEADVWTDDASGALEILLEMTREVDTEWEITPEDENGHKLMEPVVWELTISPPEETNHSVENLSAVRVTLTMDQNYRVTADFCLSEEDGTLSRNGLYRTSVIFLYSNRQNAGENEDSDEDENPDEEESGNTKTMRWTASASAKGIYESGTE